MALFVVRNGNCLSKFISASDPSGIDAIEIDSTEAAAAELYDLQGRRVNNPMPGLYIRRQGANSQKVVIR